MAVITYLWCIQRSRTYTPQWFLLVQQLMMVMEVIFASLSPVLGFHASKWLGCALLRYSFCVALCMTKSALCLSNWLSFAEWLPLKHQLRWNIQDYTFLFRLEANPIVLCLIFITLHWLPQNTRIAHWWHVCHSLLFPVNMYSNKCICWKKDTSTFFLHRTNIMRVSLSVGLLLFQIHNRRSSRRWSSVHLHPSASVSDHILFNYICMG